MGATREIVDREKPHHRLLAIHDRQSPHTLVLDEVRAASVQSWSSKHDVTPPAANHDFLRNDGRRRISCLARSYDARSLTWRWYPVLLPKMRPARYSAAAHYVMCFPRPAMRFLQCSTVAAWPTLSTGVRHCGSCCPSEQTIERWHGKWRGSAGRKRARNYASCSRFCGW